ncbi:MAG: PAS domain S-box protein [Proteobacteria bacterium]|nr:PAS domain S-box protein [Pseudomonadota bacterium]MBU1708721.1 PAS domain S-box protein [Pseudomonadota bacterium]
MKINYLQKNRLAYLSPWLSISAFALLALIIFIFAANNIQRVKKLQTESLFHKGQSLANFINAGTRTFRMMAVRGDLSLAQQFVEHAESEDQEIIYIAIVDESGKALVHSDPSKVGDTLDTSELNQQGEVPGNTCRIYPADNPEASCILEVIAPFTPFRHGKMPGRHKRINKSQPLTDDEDLRTFQETEKYTIHIGLDMGGLEETVRHHRLQMIILSIAMLLIGIGGWLSLLTAQSYKISQQTLEHMQAFTSLLISKLPLGVIATDASGKIKTFNHFAETITRIDYRNAVNKRPASILPNPFAEQFSEEMSQEIFDNEVVHTSENGQLLILNMSAVSIRDASNQFLGRVLLIHDITELKKLEKEIQRKDRFVALGKMAAGVAHEVRNPLSSIKGFATLLGSKFNPGSKEDEAAQLLVQEVERLNRSITELLNYSKPLPLNKTAINLKTFLLNSLQLIESDAQELNILVKPDLQDTSTELSVDTDRMNQVLLNIYINALQAMKPGGTLTISTVTNNNQIDIIIEDTGCGIDAENIRRIIDPYFTTKPNGTGLGLAIVQKIVEEHGGSIAFESVLDLGTRVAISLPTTDGQAKQPPR